MVLIPEQLIFCPLKKAETGIAFDARLPGVVGFPTRHLCLLTALRVNRCPPRFYLMYLNTTMKGGDQNGYF